MILLCLWQLASSYAAFSACFRCVPWCNMLRTGPMMSHGPFWSNALRGGRPRHFQPLGIEPLMKASIRNRMAPQAPRKQWLACRDQWIKGARPDSACRFHFSARLCPIVEMRWLSQTGHFDCRKNMEKKNMRKDWIWRYSMFWKRLGFAVLCRAVLLGWFKINAGRRFDRYRTEPWSKAQEEAAAKSDGWILGMNHRTTSEGLEGWLEFEPLTTSYGHSMP
jgi:hypothetical protein